MAIPKFKELFSAVLDYLDGRGEVKRSDAVREITEGLDLTPEERAETIKYGTSRAEGRVFWAIVYLVFAEAVARPKRGSVEITALGRKLRSENPSGVTLAVLEQTPGLQAWYQRTKDKQAQKNNGVSPSILTDEPTEGNTPLEDLTQAIEQLRNDVANEVLAALRSATPAFMERTVLQVLKAMGFGTPGAEDGEDLIHVGKTGDGGVDGIIHQDRLGLDKIYVQAKRYKEGNTIGVGDIRDFGGAMVEKRVTKGVFITASDFTKDAREAAEKNGGIVLIDGRQLADAMVSLGVGVVTDRTYSVYKLDENFFDE